MHSNAEDGKKLKLLEIKLVSACTNSNLNMLTGGMDSPLQETTP